MNPEIAAARLQQTFEDNFRCRNELGASVSVWQNGRELISLNGGFTDMKREKEWNRETLVPVFSATKGAAAATLLLALHRAGTDPWMETGALWPRFPLPHATVAQVMSHQCGLAALSCQASLFDHEACVRAIEQTTPAWQPPSHGYHPHTFGPLMDELMLRLTGETIATYWEREIRHPLAMDFYMTLPESEFSRVATLYPAKANPEELSNGFYREYLSPGTAVYRAFHSITGLGTVRSMNTPSAWTCGSPALGGVASARGLAAFYQACLGTGTGIFPEAVRQWMSSPVIDGTDVTLMTPTAFSCGMMVNPVSANPERKFLFGQNGFGHAGAGGSHAFADPAIGLSFGYAMNHMDLSVLPGSKTTRLAIALYNI